jgi:large subunit ribosomal protein L4
MKQTILSWDNQELGEVKLPEDIFGQPLRPDILHRVVEWQRAKAQAGTHKTKGISDISGTTKKPWKQKGTGRARQGSLRSPQFRGGAVIFGPVVRSHAYDLPKKIRRLALKVALSAKYASGMLRVLESEELASPKTSDLANKLATLSLVKPLFISGDEVHANLQKACSNIPMCDVLPAHGANVMDILRHDHLVITRAGLKAIEERLQ